MNKNTTIAVLAFALLAFFSVVYSTQAAIKTNVAGNFTFSSFATTTGAYNVSTTTSTRILATTTKTTRTYAEIVNTGPAVIYCNVNDRPAAAATSYPVYASSSLKFTVDNPYQGAVKCIASTNATGTVFVFETGY